MSAQPVGQLQAALDATGQVIASIGPEQWASPTPCPGWDAAAVASHLITGNLAFARIMRGEPPPQGAAAPAAADLLAAYREAAAELAAAFGEPGALERVVTVPVGTVPGIAALHLRITEILVHGWDLARATSQAASFPADIAEQELAFSRAKLADIPPGRTPFAPPQPVADDAPAIDRLAACLGRNVAAPVPGG